MTVHIGLIDDDSSVRRAVSRLLQTHGYFCTTYESGEAALADPAIIRMNCMIVDIQLGGMNGFEFCDQLDSVGASIPHVFITAHLETDLSDYSGRLGKSRLLTKPFEENQLIDSIKTSMNPINFDE